MTSVSAVLVNYHADACLPGCVKALRASRQDTFTLDRVVVVDNGSEPNALNALEGQAEVVANEVNRGFGAACNQGAERLESDWLLFINPDVTVEEDALQEALSLAGQHERAGILGVRLQDGKGQDALTCFRFPTLGNMLLKAMGFERFGWCPGKLHPMGDRDPSVSGKVDQVIGAFFLVRREVFDVLGGFDERYFLYFEEVDFCLRAAGQHWETWYCAEGRGVHEGMVSSRRVPVRRLAWSWRSRIRCFSIHKGPLAGAAAGLEIFLVEVPVRCLGGLLAWSPRDFLHVTGAAVLLGLSLCRGGELGSRK